MLVIIEAPVVSADHPFTGATGSLVKRKEPNKQHAKRQSSVPTSGLGLEALQTFNSNGRYGFIGL